MYWCIIFRKANEHEVNEVVKYHIQLRMQNYSLYCLMEKEHCIRCSRSSKFAFGHIPSAISVPLGELDSAVLDKMKQIYVICRTGNRSDVTPHVEKKGYANVKNVIPGMLEWKGNVEK